MMNPAAKVPKAARSDAVGLVAGKKWAPIWVAKKPKRAKSYHSRTLPTTPAMTPRRTARGVTNSWVITPGGLMGSVATVMARPQRRFGAPAMSVEVGDTIGDGGPKHQSPPSAL